MGRSVGEVHALEKRLGVEALAARIHVVVAEDEEQMKVR